ncbi:hypothetical protein BVC80_979g5 [Macleaya cordata]|uniref:Uncharacterized protein n=1 Tax=Macleaya cordata TaxID=56857 RepID=A0A200Q516_MACCD|nr:hypothetical protein BVC80_979g5 [Macleaya cordata]
MVMAFKDLFDLPLETKVKNLSKKPYMGYVAMQHVLPLFESSGIEEAHQLDQAQAFTDLMWPDGGNPSFW